MNLNEWLNQKPNQHPDVVLNELYAYLQQITDNETDEELQLYHDYLFDGLQNTMLYISHLEEIKHSIPRIRGQLCKIEQKLQTANHTPITGSMAKNMTVIDDSINEIKKLKESMKTCIKDKKE